MMYFGELLFGVGAFVVIIEVYIIVYPRWVTNISAIFLDDFNL